jgi:hypothetical protein
VVQVTVAGSRSGEAVASGSVLRRVFAHELNEVAVQLTPTPGCKVKCQPGERRCAKDAVIACEVGADGCVVWGPPQPCPAQTPLCSDGVCMDSCSDECTSSGDLRCADNGSGFQSCGQHDSDACLDWGPVTSCSDGEICKGQGRCTKTSAPEWAVAAGGGGWDKGVGIAVDTAGNIYMAGTFEGQASFGTTSLVSKGKADLFVAKVTPTGSFAWALAAGSSDQDEVNAVAVDGQGNAYITGGFRKHAKFGSSTSYSNGSSDLFVCKISPNGQLLWTATAGGAGSETGSGIAIDGKTVIVTGRFEGQVGFGKSDLLAQGKADAFVAKLSTAGQILGAHAVSGPDEVVGSAVAVDGAGNTLLVGEYEGQASFGAIELTAVGGIDLFVAKLSPAGKFIWAASAGGTGEDRALALTADPSGAAVVVGSYESKATFDKTILSAAGKTDAFVAKYTSGGGLSWAVSVGGQGTDSGDGVVLDSSGDVLVTGSFEGSGNFGGISLSSNGAKDIFVARWTPAGKILSASGSGGWGVDSGHDLALGASGSLHVTGSFELSAPFGTSKLTGKGNDDAFLWKLASP